MPEAIADEDLIANLKRIVDSFESAIAIELAKVDVKAPADVSVPEDAPLFSPLEDLMRLFERNNLFEELIHSGHYPCPPGNFLLYFVKTRDLFWLNHFIRSDVRSKKISRGELRFYLAECLLFNQTRGETCIL